MKTLGVDLRILPTDGSLGAGVAHAARELTEVLFLRAGTFDIRLYAFIPKGARISFAKEYCIELKDASGKSLRSALKKHSFDELFVPGGSIAPFLSIPAIPWVHDLAIFTHPECFPQSTIKRFLTTWAFMQGLRNAPRIFAVSEDTKRSIVNQIGIPEEKIIVTYEGVSVPQNIHALPRVLGLGQRFFLSLGTLEPIKNISFCAKAFLETGIAVKYIVAGKTGWGNVTLPNDPRIIRMEEINETEKWALLRDADALLLSSLHEGFGRTALEAMAVGTPVIASRVGAIPEVIGEQGILLAPSDSVAWKEAIEVVYGRKDHLASERAQAKIRAASFNWERVADTILASI